jgi:YVTN family beta-propeller protein
MRARGPLQLFPAGGAMLKRFIMMTLSLSSLLAWGCATVPSVVKPPLEEEGEVFVYLQPLSQDAERLRFTIDRLSLVRSDGGEFPLSLSLDEFKRNGAQRQRFVASGRVPPGRYRGLSFSVKKAALAGEEGESVLLVPEGPVTTDFSFDLARKQATVISLVLRYAESVRNGFSFSPVFSVFVPAWPASGLLGLVANRDDNIITVFDKKSGEVAAMIATGRGPEAIALDQRAGRAYVSLSGEDVIEVLDVTAGRFVNELRLNVGDGPRELSLTPDGRTLLVLNAGSRTLSFIDPLALAELGRISVGDDPRSVLVDRAGRRCYVFNVLSGTVSVIDIANRATVATLPTDPGPTRGQFNSKGDRLFVVHERGAYLSVIDPSSLSIVQRVFVGPGLSFLKVDTTTDMLYASRAQEALIEAYDPFTLVAGAYIPAMRDIVYMTIDGQENNLLLLSAENKKLMTLNLISRKIIAETDVGGSPTWLTLMGER